MVRFQFVILILCIEIFLKFSLCTDLLGEITYTFYILSKLKHERVQEVYFLPPLPRKTKYGFFGICCHRWGDCTIFFSSACGMSDTCNIHGVCAKTHSDIDLTGILEPNRICICSLCYLCANSHWTNQYTHKLKPKVCIIRYNNSDRLLIILQTVI